MIQYGYQSGTKQGGFYEVLPEKLTLNVSSTWIPSMNESLATCFHEVDRVAYSQPEKIRNLEHEIRTQRMINGNWTADLYQAIINAIEKAWKPEKFHVIGHSSGWDSRVMSSAIKHLYKKNGKDWLGDVLFVEAGGESGPFKQIMQLQRWYPKQYRVWNKANLEKDEYYHISISDRYKAFEGCVSFPMNQWYDQYVDMGLDEKNTQFFTGYGANEVDEKGCKEFGSVAKYHRWHFDLQLNWFKYFGECIHPFWDSDYILKMFSYKEIRGEKKRVTQCIVERELSEIAWVKRMDYTDIHRLKMIQGKQAERIVKEYNGSSFGRRYPATFDGAMDYNEFWGKFCLASICDYLLLKGHKIIGDI